ncbi:MAG: glycerophosphodiester phosphodiesterase family protein, partial [Pseudomonadota bacterium]
FLLHDTNLERTTNGEGVARDLTWDEISQLKLTNRDGVTAFSPPSLEAVLDWAVANNAVVQLDKKRSTSFTKIIDAVRAAKAAENVILITYTYDQAEEIAQIAPDLMMTATVEDPSDLDELAQRGVDLTRLIAWTGTRAPNPGLWEDVRARGVEIAFGTLGRRGERLDDQYWADRDGSEYNELVDQGVHLVATDYSDRVADVMVGDNRALRVCGFAR